MINFIEKGICAPKGFKANGIHCGIRKNTSKKDLAFILSDTICHCAAIYTTNKVKGAPILVTKENIKNNKAQAVIVNSGNANTCNADGIEKAEMMCKMASKETGIDKTDIVVASTGVIGQILPIEPIKNNISELISGLDYNKNDDAANAIMTTDTVSKQCAVSFMISGKECKMGAMAKGSGMINPNMATMLCFITSDVLIDENLLKKALKEVADDTFNMVSVDGDTSTNDMAVILSNGMAENKIIENEDENYNTFKKALYILLENMSKKIAKDGEGATKLIECKVYNAHSKETAKKAAKSVIMSPLVKTAIFGEDANWGRILCAIGYTDAEFPIDKVKIQIKSQYGSITVCENGAGINFSEEKASEILKSDEITLLCDMDDGNFEATAWGCDLTYDYVKINGDYRT